MVCSIMSSYGSPTLPRCWRMGRLRLLGPTCLVLEQSPTMSSGTQGRMRPGLNHLAFHAGPPSQVDALAEAGPAHDWSPHVAEKIPPRGRPGALRGLPCEHRRLRSRAGGRGAVVVRGRHLKGSGTGFADSWKWVRTRTAPEGG